MCEVLYSWRLIMNKQFLSLLLLTSFVGTTMPAAPLLLEAGQVAKAAAPVAEAVTAPFVNAAGPVIETFKGFTRAQQFPTFLSKVSNLMNGASYNVRSVFSKAGSMFAKGGSATVAKVSTFGEAGQTAVIATGLGSAGVASYAVATTDTFKNAVKATANYMGSVQDFAGYSIGTMETPVKNAVESYWARPWYTKAGETLAGYASGVKCGFVNTVNAYPKTAIATGVVAAGLLGYLAYDKMFASDSISLNEQGKVTLRTALARAKALPMTGNVWSPVMPQELTMVEAFTTESGLPKWAVKALNTFVTLDGSCKRIEFLFRDHNGRTQPKTVEIYNATRPLRDAALDQLTAAAAA